MTRQDPPPSDETGTPIGTPDEWAIWTLYRYFDADDALLYVGITSTGHRRGDQHNWTARWWGEVARATFEHFDSFDAVAEAEMNAIQAECPVYNWRFTGRGTGWYSWALEAWDDWIAEHPDTTEVTPDELGPLVGYQPRVLMGVMHHRNLPFTWDQKDFSTWRIRVADAPGVIRGLTKRPPGGWPSEAIARRMEAPERREMADRDAVNRLAAAIDNAEPLH